MVHKPVNSECSRQVEVEDINTGEREEDRVEFADSDNVFRDFAE